MLFLINYAGIYPW